MHTFAVRIWRGFEALVNRRNVARDIDDELQTHIAYATDELIATGLPPAEARRQALVAFGGLQQTREWVLRERALTWWIDAQRDLRLAVRQLRKTPASSAAIVLVIAIGIACVTTVFSLVNAAWLRPLPYPDPEQLVLLQGHAPQGYRAAVVPIAMLPELRERSRAVAALAVFHEGRAALRMDDRTVQITRTRIDSAVLAVLAVQPAFGRAPTADEFCEQAEVALVSDSLSRALFSAPPSALGRTIDVAGTPHRVIGVMPHGFFFHTRASVWTPLSIDSLAAQLRKSYPDDDTPLAGVVARLQRGMTRESLTQRMNSTGQATGQGDTSAVVGWRVVAEAPYERGQVAAGYSLAAIAFLVTAIVLVVACANVMNLLLARGSSRRREMAIAAALGASAFRLVRQLLAESLVLALFAGALGAALSALGTQLLLRAVPRKGFPGWLDFGTDWRVLLFALCVSVATMLLFGLLPAREASRVSPLQAIHEGDGSAVTARRNRTLSSRLIGVQLALSLMLVSTSGVLVAGYRSLLVNAPVGPAASLVEFMPSVDEERADRTQYQQMVSRELARALRADNEVAAVSVHGDVRDQSSRLLLTAPDDTSRTLWQPMGEWQTLVAVDSQHLSMRARQLVAGRDFSAQDSAGAPMALVVSARLAREAWGDEVVVGRTVRLGKTGSLATIVGVVEDATTLRFAQGRLSREPRVEMFFSDRQVDVINARLTVAARGDVDGLMRALHEHVVKLGPDVRLPELRTMAQAERDGLLPLQLLATVLSVVATLTLTMAAIGLFGLVQFTTVGRHREIGIRLALGATSHQVERQLLGDALRTTRVGVLVGALGAVLLLGAMRSRVPTSTAVLLTASLLTACVLSVVVFIACWLPARRAARANPNDVLRQI